jgi:hypothetical protein
MLSYEEKRVSLHSLNERGIKNRASNRCLEGDRIVGSRFDLNIIRIGSCECAMLLWREQGRLKLISTYSEPSMSIASLIDSYVGLEVLLGSHLFTI